MTASLRLTQRDQRHSNATSARRSRHQRLGRCCRGFCPGRRRHVLAGPQGRYAGRRAEASSTSCSTTLMLYSRYVPPHEANQDRERRVGQAGTGLRLIRRGSAIVVDEAVADGPGAVAGIRPGDTILSVDGRSARGKDADDRDELDRRSGSDPAYDRLAQPRWTRSLNRHWSAPWCHRRPCSWSEPAT